MTILHRPNRYPRRGERRKEFLLRTAIADPEFPAAQQQFTRRQIDAVDLLDLANALRRMAAATPSGAGDVGAGVRAVVAQASSSQLDLIHATLAALHEDLVAADTADDDTSYA